MFQILTILILKVQRTPMSSKSWFGGFNDARNSWQGLDILILIYTWSLSLICPCSEFWLSHLILKVQRTSTSFKSWFGALEDTWGSWLGICILILIGCVHWSLIHPCSEFWHLHLDLDMIAGLWYINFPNFLSLSWFWRCKKHPCSLSPNFGVWRMLKFLIGGFHPDIDLYMVIGLWFIHSLNFCSLSWFWRGKEHLCPWSPCLRMLDVPDWGLASWSWFEYVCCSLIHLYS